MLVATAIDQREVRPKERAKAFGTMTRNEESAALLGAVEGEGSNYYMPAAL